MTTCIYTVTFKRDFRYLKYLSLSIAKFAMCFEEWVIVCPTEDAAELTDLLSKYPPGMKYRVVALPMWDAKGMLWHEWQVMVAPYHCDADQILHADSDFCFISPSIPADFRTKDRPYICYDYTAALGDRWDGKIQSWRVAAEAATGLVIPVETMWQQPLVFWTETHWDTIRCIEDRHGMSIESYIREQRNQDPQTFAEFTTLGGFAFKRQHERYHWIHAGPEVRPEKRIYQAWSRVDPRPEDFDVYTSVLGASTEAIAEDLCSPCR